MNPYGIEQVNVPGLLSVYEYAKDRRMNEMLMQRKIEREDKEAERLERIQQAYARIKKPGVATAYEQPKGGDPASGGVASVPTPDATPSIADPYRRNTPTGSPLDPMTYPDAPVSVEPVAKAAPPVAEPPANWVAANQDVIDSLMAVDYKEAFQLQQQLQGMDDAQIKKAQAINAEMAKIGQHLTSFATVPQRQAELARIAPELQAMGIPQEAIQGFDVSDKNLQFQVVRGMDFDKLIKRVDDERQFRADEEYRRRSLGLQERGLGVREGALDLARKREGRVASGRGSGGGGGNTDLDYLIGGN